MSAGGAGRENLAWVDGRFVPVREAALPMTSAGARYGLNVFEGICGYAAQGGTQLLVFRLREHARRLLDSARLMQLDVDWPVEAVEAAVLETLRRNEVRGDCQIRLTIFVTGDGNATTRGPCSLVSIATPRRARPFATRGLTAAVSSWRRISDEVMPPRVKAGANYLNGRYGQLEAMGNGHDEAIFLTPGGKVAEAGSSCLFIVRDGRLATPPATAAILESITRDTVIRLARHAEMPVEAREIDRTELYLAEEAFLCGSHYEITPVTRIDGFRLGDGSPGPHTADLWTLYEAALRGDGNRLPTEAAGWLTPVHG